MNFLSDNISRIAPRILDAIAAANSGVAAAFGGDELTARVERRISGIFEHDVKVLLVVTGTAANALSLAAMVSPQGTIICHHYSHIVEEEASTLEVFSGGTRLLGVAGAHGKLTTASVVALLSRGFGAIGHGRRSAAISLSQATEAGTVYRPAEIGEIAEVARRHGLGVHVDGARFANAVAFLDVSPADLSWRAGVDILTVGASKNGALAVEAVICFNPQYADALSHLCKSSGHLVAKMRFLSAQLEAYFADDFWLRQACHANQAAQRLASGLSGLPNANISHPIEANEVFVALPESVLSGLESLGHHFHRWGDESEGQIRLVTNWDTNLADVDAFAGAVAQLYNQMT